MERGLYLFSLAASFFLSVNIGNCLFKSSNLVCSFFIVDVGIFKATPIDNNSSNITPVLLVNKQITAAGATKMRSFSETSSFDAGFTAGDIIYSAVNGGTASKLWYMNSILEVEWS